MSGFSRPDPSEHADYYARYIEQVPDGDILVTLRDQLGETLAILQQVPVEREVYRYAEGKWSLREVVGHLIDTERMFAFRALAMARSDGVDLPGMDQDEWAKRSNAGTRSLGDLTTEWAVVRRSTVHLIASFDPSVAMRTGRASGYAFTVRSFPWIIAGHELWHRGLLERDYMAGAVGGS